MCLGLQFTFCVFMCLVGLYSCVCACGGAICTCVCRCTHACAETGKTCSTTFFPSSLNQETGYGWQVPVTLLSPPGTDSAVTSHKHCHGQLCMCVPGSQPRSSCLHSTHPYPEKHLYFTLKNYRGPQESFWLNESYLAIFITLKIELRKS